MKSTIILSIAGLLLLLTVSCNNNPTKPNDHNMEKQKKGEVVYMSPDGLSKNPAFSQLVVVKNPAATIYVGGQNAIDKEGKIVGKGDIKVQAQQTLNNLKIALEAGGASLNNVVKWNVYIVQGQDSREAFGALQEDLKKLPHAPAISGVYVSSLAQPDFLVEMDAVAVVPE